MTTINTNIPPDSAADATVPSSSYNSHSDDELPQITLSRGTSETNVPTVAAASSESTSVRSSSPTFTAPDSEDANTTVDSEATVVPSDAMTAPVAGPATQPAPAPPATPKSSSKRSSRGLKAAKGHAPEDGWDVKTLEMGTVLDYPGSNEVVRRVAFPSHMVQMKPVGRWSFCKIFMDADFCAAGCLSIPVGAAKEGKSVKDNTYVFYVVEGAVNFKVHRSTYLLAPGGMIMVTRGNVYSVTNACERTAKLVFFQSRRVTEVITVGDDPLNSNRLPPTPAAPLPFLGSKATVILGLLLERLLKQSVKYRAVLWKWYLKTSFEAARSMTGPRPYLLCLFAGYLLRGFPFFGNSKFNLQIIRSLKPPSRSV